MSDHTTAALLSLLDLERTALCGSDYSVLDDLADRKKQLIAAMAESEPHPKDVEKIRKKLSENQALLSAAIAGVKSARDRITELQKVRSGLGVYDQTGQIAQSLPASPEMEKKA